MKTKGRYVLETIPIGIDDRPSKTIEALIRAAHSIVDEWVAMGCPEGELLVEFAERKQADD